MSAILNKFIILIFIIDAASAADLQCISGTITQTEFGKIKSEITEFCFNETKTTLISKNCYSSKCEALDNPHKFKIQQLLSQVGKPGFKLCRELSGTPQIIEFQVAQKFYKLDRCLFKDNSFVDTDYLLSHYLER